ncbi:MAG: agmatinase [Marinicellaceae bacterium]
MINLLGIPSDINSSFLKGPAKAPDIIREMELGGSANVYSENGTQIKSSINFIDLGNIPIDSKNAAELTHNAIVEYVSAVLDDNNSLICMGGDHAVSYPILEAHAKIYPQLNILHFDAHPDLYHNFQNNPYSHASPFARIMENNFAQSLTQVGVRTLDPHQRKQVKKFNVTAFEMHDFNAQKVLQHINQLDGPLYISIDIDALDPACAPGVSHHEPGGLQTREIISILQGIKLKVIGADIVEYNPDRDINHMTAMVAYKLLKEVMALAIKS